VLDADVLDRILNDANTGKKAREVEIKLIARLRKQRWQRTWPEMASPIVRTKLRTRTATQRNNRHRPQVPAIIGLFLRLNDSAQRQDLRNFRPAAGEAHLHFPPATWLAMLPQQLSPALFSRCNPLIFRVERVMGIEPTSKAWEALVLPLNYTRTRKSHSVYQFSPGQSSVITGPGCAKTRWFWRGFAGAGRGQT
jgi:hypothetical protein